MGFFDAFKTEKVIIGNCLYCDFPIAQTTNKSNGAMIQKPQYLLTDGKCICSHCLKQKGIPTKNIEDKSSSDIISIMSENGMAIPSQFKPTNRVMWGVSVPYIEIDEPRQLINIPEFEFNVFSSNKYVEHIYSFSSLIDFELIDSGQKLMEGSSLLGAAVGGLAFGGAGAIVGSSFGNKKIKDKCTGLTIKVIFDDINNSDTYINLIPISEEIDRSSSKYKEYYSSAQKCLSILTVILNKNHKQLSPGNNPTISVDENDVLDSIRKLGTLKDEGLITLEEFNIKKKDLLSRL